MKSLGNQRAQVALTACLYMVCRGHVLETTPCLNPCLMVFQAKITVSFRLLRIQILFYLIPCDDFTIDVNVMTICQWIAER